MSHFKVESGIPIAPVRRNNNAKRQSKYPFATMKVGDSFSSPLADAQLIRSAAHVWGKALGARFVVRKLESQVRCWRES